MSDKIKISVDGRQVETENRKMLLDIIREMGLNIPTLCHHDSLTPSGACRLCVVEVTKESWKGASKIVTSCLYPAEEGLIVKTRSDQVLKTRRTLLEMYMALCPGSEEIKNMARLEGVDTSSYTIGAEENRCVLCGLCTRVCQDCGPGAISTLGRGIDKEVAPGPDLVGDDCTGCRACAYICPTGAIPLEQKEGKLTIWNRQFEIPVCKVDQSICRGCGICEEVCPFSIPRTSMVIESEINAYISPTACLGCGICAGACPTGAISQVENELITPLTSGLICQDLRDREIVFACSRSPLPGTEDDLIKVSCIGSVDLSTILYCFAAGAKGVALMCRDRLSCPYQAGGELGEKRLEDVLALFELLGLSKDQAALLSPEPGQDGPLKAWLTFKSNLKPNPEASLVSGTALAYPYTGLDQALKMINALKERPDLKLTLPPELAAHFKPLPEKSNNLLYLGNLPELQILFARLTGDPVVSDLVESAVKLLRQNNIYVRPAMTIRELEESPEAAIYVFAASDLAERLPDRRIITLNEVAGVEETEAEVPFTFTIDEAYRKKLIAKLPAEGESFSCATLSEYLQYALLLRSGAWLKSLAGKPRPAFGFDTGSARDNSVRLPAKYRICNHPILPPLDSAELTFTFNDLEIKARENEVITSALYAAGIHTFGHHSKDGGAQGIYCVNGQCSQCMVIADGKPVKGCMTPVTEGMVVNSVEGLPVLSNLEPSKPVIPATPEYEVDVLIIGGGPAGISAAIELGNVGIDTLIIDDKQHFGGKLSLQTHNFFGSVADCWAGYRGVEIGEILTENLNKLPTVKKWLNSTVVGVFSDGKFAVAGNGTTRLVKANKVLFSTGAREKSLAFPGADLPGVYGAGAFQTLVNRDLIRCAERLFIIGGGNVGLIGAYHALQAGIDVVGLVEALPRCGGYKVHEDKIKRFGVPVWTSHTVLRIEGSEKAERVITAAVDENFKPIPGTEKSFEVDTVLIAVGLSPVDELLEKAIEYGIEAYAAGDSNEIAEASAAIFSGRIIGRRIAQASGIDLPVPSDWEAFGETLKHHAGESDPFLPQARDDSVYPIIRCMQEIPCNPCTEACPKNCITMKDSILALPEFGGECIGCGRCVLACPGLAINLVMEEYDPAQEKALLMMPFEFVNDIIPIGREVKTTDMEGNLVGSGKVIAYRERDSQNSRRLLLLEVPYEQRLDVAGFRIREIDEGAPVADLMTETDDPIVCRCERVRKSEIVKAIRAGVRDMNQLKALVRTGLGGCNGKTCTDLILRIYREEGVALSELTMLTHRPLVAEVHLGDFIANETGGE
jgi:ferredoxin